MATVQRSERAGSVRGDAEPSRTVDVHTFIAPALECVYDRSSEALRSQWRDVEEHVLLTTPTPGVGDWPSSYLRLADGGRTVEWTPSPAPFPEIAHAVAPSRVPPGVLHDNAVGRLEAMDALAIAVHVISPALRLDADFLGPAVSRTLFDSYNRYVTDYCAVAPERLKAVVQLHGGEPYWSEEQLDALGGLDAVTAATVHLPPKIVPDSPYFASIWRALERSGLPLLHRPGAGFPWWTPPRLLSYLAGTGVLERHPAVRLLFAGWPAGWLADWCEQHAASLVRYVREGRVFFAIDADESEDDVTRVISTAGEGCLVWQSCFPFGGATVAEERLVFLPPATRLSVLAENAAACFGVADLRNATIA